MMKNGVYFIVIALNSTVIWAWQRRMDIPSPKLSYIMVKVGRIWRELSGVLTRTVIFFSF